MGDENPKSRLVFAISLTIAFVLQVIGTVRYIGRVVTAILFAVLAVVHYAQWASAKKRRE